MVVSEAMLRIDAEGGQGEGEQPVVGDELVDRRQGRDLVWIVLRLGRGGRALLDAVLGVEADRVVALEIVLDEGRWQLTLPSVLKLNALAKMA